MEKSPAPETEADRLKQIAARAKKAQTNCLPFPKYLVNMGGNKRFLSINETGKAWDCGHCEVTIDDHLVLEEDFSLRDITPTENRLIDDIADEYSASK